LPARSGFSRPDLALLDREGRAIAVIEVVLTHPPEPTILEYYQQNRIAVVIYTLQSERDIERLDGEILEPTHVNLCTNPKCERCGGRMLKKQLLVINAKCWKCHQPMNVAALHSRSGYIGVGDFSDSDIQLANQNGCFLKYQYSHVVAEKYIANTCPNCRKFIGNHYLLFGKGSRRKANQS
jgi:hypothetical protein